MYIFHFAHAVITDSGKSCQADLLEKPSMAIGAALSFYPSQPGIRPRLISSNRMTGDSSFPVEKYQKRERRLQQ